MRRYSITYFIGQSIKGLWRNGVMSVASITVLMSCLAVMGSFSLLVYNINYNLKIIGLLNEIAVFIESEKTDLEIADIENQIKSFDNVNKVTYLSREEILEEERQRYNKIPDIFKIMDERNDNPYHATFIVTYYDVARVPTLKYNLDHIDGVGKTKCRIDLAQTIDDAKNGIIIIFMWFLAILFVVSIFVIINTIKLAVHARRQEINIMRYVGATNWFIVLPFIFEGILIGMIASSFAYFIQWYSYNYIYSMIISDFQMIEMVAFNDINIYVILAFLGVGIFSGILGSCISLSKYLKA